MSEYSTEPAATAGSDGSPKPHEPKSKPPKPLPRAKEQQPAEGVSAPPKEKVDLREQLANEGAVGLITDVPLPEANITQLNGIMLDIDPKLYDGRVARKETKADPARFYKKIVRPMLERHPVLAKAQVRASGTGLHVILWFTSPVVFRGEPQRLLWAAVVKVVQRALPSDPDAPGITALTRPVGSINGKNGMPVTMLTKGEPVTPEEAMSLFNEIRVAPVKTIMRILLGEERISLCPICEKPGTSLDAMDRSAKCYGSCGKVTLSQIYDLFLCPRPAGKEE